MAIHMGKCRRPAPWSGDMFMVKHLRTTWSMKQRKGRRILSSHWPVNNICFSHWQQRWSGHSRVCLYKPRGPAIGFKESFCGNIPWSHSPRLAGWSEQPEGRSSWETFLSKWQWNLPQSFPRLLASGSSGASASQWLSPGYWCPLPTSGSRIRLVGAARGRKTPGLCQPVSEGLKHTIYRLFPGAGNSFPLPSLTGYVTQPHTCKGMTWLP